MCTKRVILPRVIEHANKKNVLKPHLILQLNYEKAVDFKDKIKI